MERGPDFTGGEQAGDGKHAGGGWAFPALLALLLLIAAWYVSQRPVAQETQNGPTSSNWSPTPEPTGKTVGLTIDYGNGVQKNFAALPWREGITVAELMQEASQFRPGITFTKQGEGESGFLSSIDGLNNNGVGRASWRYEVNENFGQVSFCLQKLEPGDRVLWKFAPEE